MLTVDMSGGWDVARMNTPAHLHPVCYSEPVPDSTPSVSGCIPPFFVKPFLLIRSSAIHSLCTFVEHLVSAGVGNTASVPIKLRI